MDSNNYLLLSPSWAWSKHTSGCYLGRFITTSQKRQTFRVDTEVIYSRATAAATAAKRLPTTRPAPAVTGWLPVGLAPPVVETVGAPVPVAMAMGLVADGG